MLTREGHVFVGHQRGQDVEGFLEVVESPDPGETQLVGELCTSYNLLRVETLLCEVESGVHSF